MENKTALTELIWFMSDGLNELDESIKASEIWKKANKLLEIEKKQIIDAYNEGFLITTTLTTKCARPEYKTSEKYYNQTYNNGK